MIHCSCTILISLLAGMFPHGVIRGRMYWPTAGWDKAAAINLIGEQELIYLLSRILPVASKDEIDFPRMLLHSTVERVYVRSLRIGNRTLRAIVTITIQSTRKDAPNHSNLSQRFYTAEISSTQWEPAIKTMLNDSEYHHTSKQCVFQHLTTDSVNTFCAGLNLSQGMREKLRLEHVNVRPTANQPSGSAMTAVSSLPMSKGPASQRRVLKATSATKNTGTSYTLNDVISQPSGGHSLLGLQGGNAVPASSETKVITRDEQPVQTRQEHPTRGSM